MDGVVGSAKQVGFVILPAEIMKLAPTIGPAAVLVYAVLAQHADEDGVCWPSVRRVAEMSGMSTSTIRRSLKALTSNSVLAVEVRSDRMGQSSNIYRLLITQEPPYENDRGGLSNLPHPPVKSTSPPCQKRKGPPVKSDRGTIPIEQEPVESDSKNENQRTRKAAPSMSVSEVWEYYRTKRPKVRVLGDDVEKNIKARLKKFTVEEICRAIDGNFRSPYHCGQNDRQTEYHELELIVRNDTKVNMFLAVPENGQPVLSTKIQRTLLAGKGFLADRRENGEQT